MSEEVGVKFSNFLPLRQVTFRLDKDEETGVESLILDGIAHGYKPNLKNFIITQGAARKAVRKFNDNLKKGRVHQIWIDHAYANFFANGTPSDKVIGHLTKIKATDDGLWYEMNLNTEHPSQIHKAIMRRDIKGVSIGADAKKENIRCSACNNPIMSVDCEHMIGQKLDNGKIVCAVVEDYELDEVSVTAKPADLESSINFSIFTLDNNGNVIEQDGLEKESGETFKNIKKYENGDKDMTDSDGKDNARLEQDYVSKEELEAFATKLLQDVKTNVSTSNEELVTKLLQAQKDEKVLAEKNGLVVEIIQLNDKFTKDELLAFDVGFLKKLKAEFTPSENTSINSGKARVGDDMLDSGSDEKFLLTREMKKAWFRIKMGWSPEAPKHIQRKVRARLNHDDNEEGEKFREWLLSKQKGDN